MPAPTIPAFETRHRLALAREHAGLSQEQLAARLEVARTTISNYESGATTRLRRPTLRAWADACGVDLDWLLTGGEPPTPPVKHPKRTPATREMSRASTGEYPQLPRVLTRRRCRVSAKASR